MCVCVRGMCEYELYTLDGESSGAWCVASSSGRNHHHHRIIPPAYPRMYHPVPPPRIPLYPLPIPPTLSARYIIIAPDSNSRTGGPPSAGTRSSPQGILLFGLMDTNPWSNCLPKPMLYREGGHGSWSSVGGFSVRMSIS